MTSRRLKEGVSHDHHNLRGVWQAALAGRRHQGMEASVTADHDRPRAVVMNDHQLRGTSCGPTMIAGGLIALPEVELDPDVEDAYRQEQRDRELALRTG